MASRPRAQQDLPGALVDHGPVDAGKDVFHGQVPVHQQDDLVLPGEPRQTGDELSQIGFGAADLSRSEIEQADDDLHRPALGRLAGRIDGGESPLSDRSSRRSTELAGRDRLGRHRVRGGSLAGRFSLRAEHLHGGLQAVPNGVGMGPLPHFFFCGGGHRLVSGLIVLGHLVAATNLLDQRRPHQAVPGGPPAQQRILRPGGRFRMRVDDKPDAGIEIVGNRRMGGRNTGPARRQIIHQRQTIPLRASRRQVVRAGAGQLQHVGFTQEIRDQHHAAAMRNIQPAVKADHAVNRLRAARYQLQHQRGVVAVAQGIEEGGNHVFPILAAVVRIENAGIDDAAQVQALCRAGGQELLPK